MLDGRHDVARHGGDAHLGVELGDERGGYCEVGGGDFALRQELDTPHPAFGHPLPRERAADLREPSPSGEGAAKRRMRGRDYDRLSTAAMSSTVSFRSITRRFSQVRWRTDSGSELVIRTTFSKPSPFSWRR